MPIKNCVIDGIFAGELIEHLENPGLFLSECKRVLKRNGVIIITTPNPFSFEKRGLFHKDHVMCFTLYHLENLVKRYFRIVDRGYCEIYVRHPLRILEKIFPLKRWHIYIVGKKV